MSDDISSPNSVAAATFATSQDYLNAFYNDAKSRWRSEEGIFLVGIKDHEQLENQFRWKNYRRLQWEGLTDEAGFILVSPSGIPELWIDRDIGSADYNKVYRMFLRDIIKINDVKTALTGYDLDHVYSFSSAQTKKLVRYILLLPVTSSVNRSYASLERTRSGDMRGQKVVHGGDYFTFAKAMGIKGPSFAKSAKNDVLKHFIDRLISSDCIKESSKESDMNALKVLYNRIKQSAPTTRQVAKNTPKLPRGTRKLSSKKKNS